MDDEFEKELIREAGRISLARQEKAIMRKRLVSFIRMQPMCDASGEVFSTATHVSADVFNISFIRYTAVLLSIVALIVGGISYAAEGSLPGDVLYPLKVNLNEKIVGAFSLSQEAKASWEAVRIDRRLEEAEQLGAAGRFSAGARAKLTEEFEASVKRAAMHIMELQTNGDMGEAAALSSDLESSLGSHHRILASMARDNKETGGDLQEIAEKIKKESDSIGLARKTLEKGASQAGTERAEASLQGKLGAAEQKLKEVRAYLDKKNSGLDDTARQWAEDSLTKAEALIADARSSMDAKSYEDAFRQLQEAMQISQDAKQFSRAKANYNIDPGAESNEDDSKNKDVPKDESKKTNNEQNPSESVSSDNPAD